MAKLQFLRVGWGGVGMMTVFELEHMLDAKQLCLSCHCTHAGCYATVFVLSLHTCWMLRNCVCLVIAHMLDATQLCLSCHCTHAGCYATVFVLSLHTCWMLRNCVCLVIAHMLDATQLCLSCHCTHAGCYATVFVLSLHTCWMLRNCVCLVIANMLDAMQLRLSCHCTHAGCYATVFVLSLHTCWMLRNCVCLVIANMLDAMQLCLSCHCTHAGCYATVFVLSLHTCWMLRNCVCLTCGRTCLKHWVNWPTKQTMPEDGEKTTSFFRRMVPIRTNSKQNAFVKTRTHGKNGTKWTYEPTDHKWKSTPLQHFVHLQQNDMWISPRVAITAVTLFWGLDFQKISGHLGSRWI